MEHTGMNEQILKLVEQARQYAWENEKHWSAGPEREALFEAKFFELIINECAKFIDTLPSDMEASGDNVKQHFRIE